ncbi:MAG TPA: molybdopterin-dependent oxidoreductase [Saprospiraceae bacterium]|nr:molybdopterin-dependent oxidoreductase [Saprospiraceae bacterium]
MINIDAVQHVTGRSIYLDDIPELQGTLHALPFDAPTAHAKILRLDVSKAQKAQGVVTILTAKDIPGENQIGGIIPDEPLFAEGEIHYWGQPIGIIVAESEYYARMARKLIQIECEELEVITDPRKAAASGLLITKPRTFAMGNLEDGWNQSRYIFEGRADTNGQEHLYIEGQGAYARMKENGSILISSSTQGPTQVQRATSRVLGLPMHKIEIDVVRLGGGFGGKEDQATPWAVMTALATYWLQKPVKMVLHRLDDIRMTGKRHPYSSDYKIGLDGELKIKAYEVTFYQNAGAAADLSPAVLERSLFHATNAYFVPNVKATGMSCKTNLPPNTAFRGFGGPQGMFVIESAIAHAAQKIGVEAWEIQQRNLLRDGDHFSYGQMVDQGKAVETWNQCVKTYNLTEKLKKRDDFNNSNTWNKKGLAVQPVCFGISFTNTMMNHARALVHIYQDGSIAVSTGAVEMGQGVNTKMVQVVQQIFGIPADKIRIETTNTLRIANTSPTAASAGADLNGKALEMACRTIWKRMQPVASILLSNTSDSVSIKEGRLWLNNESSEHAWEDLVTHCLQRRISLSEQAHYATPDIHFNKNTEKGHPFAYHVYGTAIIDVTVDCLRGIYTIDGVHIVHDFGKSMNLEVDIGQVEGGVVQGIGWMTLEEVMYSPNGRLMTNTLSTYKIPDIYAVPHSIQIKAYESEGHPLAILKSKAVGEPPLMYGLGAYFALRNAVTAFTGMVDLPFDAPYTPEKVLLDLFNLRNTLKDKRSEKDFLEQRV